MRLHIDLATPPQTLALALAAATEVLIGAGVTPFEGAAAMFKLEGESEDLTPAEERALDAWEAAESAAILACCGPGMPDLPVHLELAPDPHGELWVIRRPSGRWVWEVLLERAPHGGMGRWISELSHLDYGSEREARDAGQEVLDAVRQQLLR